MHDGWNPSFRVWAQIPLNRGQVQMLPILIVVHFLFRSVHPRTLPPTPQCGVTTPPPGSAWFPKSGMDPMWSNAVEQCGPFCLEFRQRWYTIIIWYTSHPALSHAITGHSPLPRSNPPEGFNCPVKQAPIRSHMRSKRADLGEKPPLWRNCHLLSITC